MKKKLSRASALFLTVVIALSFAAGAAAASGLQEITAYLNSNITFKLEGEEQILTDATGVRTYPITYNGTTYVPIRSVANLMGVGVDWDQATQTILLGKQPGGIDLIDTYLNYYHDDGWPFNWVNQNQTGDKDPTELSGITCSNWLEFFKPMNYNSKSTSSISFNLTGKHDTLTFSFYAVNSATLRVLGDNDTVLFEKTVTGGQVAQTVTIPLFKTSQLTFVMTDVEYGQEGRAYVFNAYLDAE